jgi:ELWxxDGT repeat protein
MRHKTGIRSVLLLLAAMIAALFSGALLHVQAQAQSIRLHATLAPEDWTEPVLVKDINRESARVHPLAASQDALFFAADDGVHGRELWRTNGTANGTALVKDAWPGPACSQASYNCRPPVMVHAGDFLFLTLNDGEHGWELWRSDGTDSGTTLVKDIFPGSSNGIDPQFGHTQLLVVDGVLYLAADDATNGIELWRSDGTEAGTWLVSDIDAGESGSKPSGFVEMNGLLYFTAITDQAGRELWRSDGTAAGTWMVKDVNPQNSAYGAVGPLAVMGDNLYFKGRDERYGEELWRSDGTEPGTVLGQGYKRGRQLRRAAGTNHRERIALLHS